MSRSAREVIYSPSHFLTKSDLNLVIKLKLINLVAKQNCLYLVPARKRLSIS